MFIEDLRYSLVVKKKRKEKLVIVLMFKRSFVLYRIKGWEVKIYLDVRSFFLCYQYDLFKENVLKNNKKRFLLE